MVSQVLPRMVRRGLVRALDHAQIPNLKNLEPRFTSPAFDDGNKHGVPYQWGTVGLLYDKKKLPNLEPTWGVLFDPPKIAGTFVLIDEMRDMLSVALRYKGFSINTHDPEQIREVEAGAMLSLFVKYASPNTAAQAKLPAEDRTNPYIYPSREILDRLEHYRDIGEAAKVFDEVWTAIKAQ